jgi:glutaryl-CoA dehydrogenase
MPECEYPGPLKKPTLTHILSLQEIFGGNAVSDEYGIGRHVANLFVTQTYEGQSDIHGKLKLP